MYLVPASDKRPLDQKKLQNQAKNDDKGALASNDKLGKLKGATAVVILGHIIQLGGTKMTQTAKQLLDKGGGIMVSVGEGGNER